MCTSFSGLDILLERLMGGYMNTPVSEAAITVRDEHLQMIANYYGSTQVDYDLVWHANEVGALHYGWWDDTTHNLKEALQRENEILADKANIQKGEHVLDAGCGVGGSSVFLAGSRGADVVGITVSPLQIRLAKERARREGVESNTSFLGKIKQTGVKFHGKWPTSPHVYPKP
jgi:cyclopropane fatty-acyl-phospholipid synthase-like methyltransferase